MKGHAAGLIELFVVLMFAVGWGVLELVILRMDRRRARRIVGGDGGADSASDSRHAERQ
jgi:hypothetical protein